MAQILVVKPKSLTPTDKKLLRDSGVVCVEAADPSQVRLIQPEGPVLSGDELFYAAMVAIAKGPSNTVREIFANNLHILMEQHMQNMHKAKP